MGEGRAQCRGDRQQDKDRTEDDSLRSFPIVLPKLPEAMVQNASLEAGDWLTQVRPLIADVSSKAVIWWDRMVESTFQRYQQWLSASPLEKLRIRARRTRTVFGISEVSPTSVSHAHASTTRWSTARNDSNPSDGCC